MDWLIDHFMLTQKEFKMMYTVQNSKYNILSLTAREHILWMRMKIKNEKHADFEWQKMSD